MESSADKKEKKITPSPSSALTKKIRMIMEQVKFQAKLQEKINPKLRSYYIPFEEKEAIEEKEAM